MQIKLRQALFSGLLSMAMAFTANAQCPVANTCTPGAAPVSAHIFGMGIYNVMVSSGTTGLVNLTSSGASDGYKDYSCTKKATITEGTTVPVTITTNPNADENVRIWIDLNNNGTFDAATELVFSSNNARTHSGTITIPVSATVVKNTLLRMRVSSDDKNSVIPTPCSTPKYGQVEDYGITVLVNAQKPTVNFIANKPVTCSPTVQFTQQVQNGATSYRWTFNDPASGAANTSTAANPTHTFSTPGTYTIKLKACNANGCDSLTKTNYITYHTNVPVAASCSPATTAFCCGYGITKFTLGAMVNTSADASAGYEDFTCTNSATVEEGVSYPVAVQTGTANPQDTWVYIDYNNNGAFESSELVFSKLNAVSPSGNILIRGGSLRNTPLRVRVISDEIGSNAASCAPRTTGQVEDYTLIITPNTRKPAVSFTSNFATSCDTLVQFTDASLNAPTTWTWNFGDGTPVSNLQNPLHKYTTSGTYNVKLKACNANGCDSLSIQNYVTITKPCLQYCQATNNNTQLYITNVTFNTINNTSGLDAAGYGNYTAKSTPVIKGNAYTISVTGSAAFTRTNAIWIDYNQDGDFTDAGEQVILAQSGLTLSG